MESCLDLDESGARPRMTAYMQGLLMALRLVFILEAIGTVQASILLL